MMKMFIFLCLNLSRISGQLNRQIHATCSQRGHDLSYKIELQQRSQWKISKKKDDDMKIISFKIEKEVNKIAIFK